MDTRAGVTSLIVLKRQPADSSLARWHPMGSINLKPYNLPHNLDQDARFLCQITSIPYYEVCARLCEEFTQLYNLFIAGQGLHGAARLDYWVLRCFTHAESIRRGVGFVKNGGDYMPMIDILDTPSIDYRGIVGQPLGWTSDEECKRWDSKFSQLSYVCGTGSTVLRNNLTKGIRWLNRHSIGRDRIYLDRDDGDPGDAAGVIQRVEEYGIISPPKPYPKHVIDLDEQVHPNDRCPRIGVWVPGQWLDGATDFSLAFCVEGHPMQPAYRIKGLELNNPFSGYDEEMATEYEAIATGSPVTEAVDTTWHFASQPVAQPTSLPHLYLRYETGHPCTKSGYWITPAKSSSRRLFSQGTLMPEVVPDYGSTIWQWDSDQSDPKL